MCSSIFPTHSTRKPQRLLLAERLVIKQPHDCLWWSWSWSALPALRLKDSFEKEASNGLGGTLSCKSSVCSQTHAYTVLSSNMHIRTNTEAPTWVSHSLLSIRLSRLTSFLTFWSGLAADNLGRRGAGNACLLELKSFQVVDCYHSQSNWRQSWHSCLWALLLLFL